MTNVQINGFNFNKVEWTDNILLFKESNITNNQIQLTFLSVKQNQYNTQIFIYIIFNKVNLNDINNQTWTVSVKCYNEIQFLFYTTENTVQGIDLRQKIDIPPLILTQLNITSFESRQLQPNQDIQETRSYVPSTLFLSFSLLKFNEICAWIIFVLPEEITIGRVSKSEVIFSDCSGQSQSFIEGSQIDKDSIVGYSKECNCIFISCPYLKSIALQDQNDKKCLNNQIQLQNVENPELAVPTQNLLSYITNYKLPQQSDWLPPYDFNATDLNLTSSQYTYSSYENVQYKGIDIKQEFDATEFSLINFSDYKNDVTTYSLTISFPIYLLTSQNEVEVYLPFQLQGQDPEEDVQCDTSAQFEGQLRLEVVDQVVLLIKITGEMSPQQKISCTFINCSAKSQQPQQTIEILVYAQGDIIAQMTKTANIQGTQPIADWISFPTNNPLVISDSSIGKRSVGYTFIIQSLNIVKEVQQSSRFIIITIDQLLAFENIVKCQVANNNSNSMSNPQDNQNSTVSSQSEISCQIASSNTIQIEASSLSSSSFQLSIIGIKNPSVDIDQSNTKNTTLSFQLSYIWQRNKGEIDKFTHTIASSILKVDYNFTCLSSCSGCSSSYMNCTVCPKDYPITNYQGNLRTCVASCDSFQVMVGSECKQCQVDDLLCASCSSSDTTVCTACITGYAYEPSWKRCLDENFMKNNKYSYLFAQNNGRILREQSRKNQTRITQQDARSQNSQNVKSSNNDGSSTANDSTSSDSKDQSSIRSRLKDSLGEIQNGKVIFVYAELAAVSLTILLVMVKGQIKRNQKKRSMIRATKGKTQTRKQEDDDEEEEGRGGLHHFKKRAFMLAILSIPEAIELPCSLMWAFSISGGSWEHPVLQGMIGVASLSALQWMLDVYQQAGILLNDTNTPLNSCLLNPLSKKNQEGNLYFVTKLFRFLFCLNPKGICLTLTNLSSKEGSLSLPFSEGAARNSILLTSLRKILVAQIRSNGAGISALCVFLYLNYSELMENYAFMYDLILFKMIMMLLCYLNTKLIDSFLKHFEETPDSS